MTKFIIETSPQIPVSRQRVEIVERKGTGHPDTICDAIMEEVSVALCREYLATFGQILHHNIDKALLVAGRTVPRPGGGTVEEPMRLIFGDRATTEYRGKRIAVGEIAEAAAKTWLREHLRYVTPEKHIYFQNELKCGSTELMGIFEQPVVCANDTSAVVGYAPDTDTERLVRATEHHVNSAAFKLHFPEVGEDVKVMGYRRDRDLLLTLAIAFVDRHIRNIAVYFSRKEEIRLAIIHFLATQQHSLSNIHVQINTLDNPEQGESGAYLTVLGTSAENGDCGQVGRGNKANGLISLNRPMNTEAVAGKNPLSHVGKIYTLLARQIAEKIHVQVPGLAEVNFWLGSQIGKPLDRPAIASAQLIPQAGLNIEEIRPQVTEIIELELAGIGDFSARLARGELPVC